MDVPFSQRSTSGNLGKPGVGYPEVLIKTIEIDELVDENFRGSCILKIYQAYTGSSKSISLSVEEIVVRAVDRKESYFADESDDEY